MKALLPIDRMLFLPLSFLSQLVFVNHLGIICKDGRSWSNALAGNDTIGNASSKPADTKQNIESKTKVSFPMKFNYLLYSVLSSIVFLNTLLN